MIRSIAPDNANKRGIAPHFRAVLLTGKESNHLLKAFLDFNPSIWTDWYTASQRIHGHL